MFHQITTVATISKPIDWPAWISAGSALVGVPLAFTAFLKLIRRDKDREAQIAKLSTIAAVLENQTTVMQKHVDLVATQVDILRNASLNGGENADAVSKLQAIEEQKLRLSVLPRLWLNGASSKGYSGELQIDLNNKGETAILDEFNVISGELDLYNQLLPYSLDKGASRLIFGKATKRNISDTQYSIEILYHNILDQPYRAVMEGKGPYVKIVSDGPVENNAEDAVAEPA